MKLSDWHVSEITQQVVSHKICKNRRQTETKCDITNRRFFSSMRMKEIIKSQILGTLVIALFNEHQSTTIWHLPRYNLYSTDFDMVNLGMKMVLTELKKRIV